jgi:hypothetical protein
MARSVTICIDKEMTIVNGELGDVLKEYVSKTSL